MPTKEKRKKPVKKVRTVEDVLDCTQKCTGFPYSCLDCSKEPIWKE
jgi:hypothetical protein